ncbi:DUF805 domain-containing protein [Priestia megaterium]|uniref:DUF805 domain-containing protein n=1 Tax=Priestia megaterium TaxID=1404 RepID=UPI0006AB90B8|nr:DUF805 domain-containing protein [Priestia megaterium]KOP74934.1 hypothetical protein AMS61_11530 [Bacillus sp. FJAT-21351]KQU11814.1 hypothetical protein ASG61_15025 [Bacillus sp. Leaf75]USL22397.1 DUF805 domain-containing protein [Priestia megaterium]WDM36288.1 DUF805 domain-containing protein [Priestia megaterium]
MKWYLHVLKNYATFQGRATRKEYWMFVLFNFIMWCVLSAIELITDMPPFLRIVYLVAVFIPSLAVTARRLHDIGRSSWWYLINFVPVIGGIWLLILFCKRSEVTANIYDTDTQAS